MTDFETHPVGTAARIEQLEAALTSANAATAAAYEVAAQIADDFVRMRERQIETEKSKSALHVDVPRIMRWQAGKVQSKAIADEVRALATPDQTAALDRLIAEAEARVWKEAEKLVRPTRGKSGNGIVVAALHRVADALLEASKKGDA